MGGDIISGVIAAGLNRSDGVRMLIDVGANAEIVLGNRDWLLACAGAAGPALEGGVVERGMQAMAGAIDSVRIDRKTLEPEFQVIGGGKASGICGSGLIELVAEMFSSKIVNIQGKFTHRPELRPPQKHPGRSGVCPGALLSEQRRARDADLRGRYRSFSEVKSGNVHYTVAYLPKGGTEV